MAALMALPQSAEAAVTLTLRGRSSLKPYTLKAGFTVTVPDSWALAYVRTYAAPCTASKTVAAECLVSFAAQ